MAFGGLYGDLPSAKDHSNEDVEKEKKKEGWAGSGLFAPANLIAKRQSAQVALSVLRAAASSKGKGSVTGAAGQGPTLRASAADAKADGEAGSVLLAAASTNDGPITITATAAPTLLPGVSLGEDIKDEYDPAKPNDYEAVRRAREQQRREAELEAARQERLREEEQRRKEEEERMREMRELEALELARDGEQQGAAGPAGEQQQDGEQRRAALQLSGEDAWKRRGMLSQPAGSGEGSGGVGGLGFAGGAGRSGSIGGGGQAKGMSLAQRMLERMGWKEGEGLGRNRQGMATPLMMQKVDVRTGVIVNAAPSTAAQPGAGGEQPAKRSATFNRPPTRVVLLTNMVGPGEVDQELDGEVGEECSKYGTVTNVLIFEVTEPGFPADQAVRIFVQFDRAESATKALVDLQGRFFGGREVEAQFFEEERFERRELAPQPDEVRR